VRENLALRAFREGRVSVGATVGTNDVLCAQIMATSGFDWLYIDMEHGPVPFADVQNAIVAIRTTTTEPFVRTRWNDATSIEQALDCGASGIIVPMINNRADAEAVVAHARYRPLGERSRGGLRAAFSFATDRGTYLREANDRVLVLVQIETAEAVANIEEIMGVEGINGVFVGPNDLASSYGLVYPRDWEKRPTAYATAIDDIPGIARKHGKIPGIQAANAARANECIERGYLFVGVGSDATILAAGAQRERAGVNLPGGVR
jgi:4-hydroxy-2-oxoheptanedioate aldolase